MSSRVIKKCIIIDKIAPNSTRKIIVISIPSIDHKYKFYHGVIIIMLKHYSVEDFSSDGRWSGGSPPTRWTDDLVKVVGIR